MESMGRTLVFKFLWEMGTSLNNGIWCQTLISALSYLGLVYHFFSSQPGGIFEAKLNILFSKLGIGLKDIFASFTAGKEIKDDVDWNTGSFDVGFAMANLSICNNASHRFLLKSVKGLRVEHHSYKNKYNKLYGKLQVRKPTGSHPR